MRRQLAAFTAAVVVATTAAACGSSSSSSSSSSSTPASSGPATLNVGTLLPQTGDLAFLGPPMVKAVQLAVQDINAAGGVNGKPVTLDMTDDGTDVNVASQSVQKLINDKVSAIIGAAASGVTLGVIDKITNAGIVECSPSNTAATFTTYPDHGFYFRTAPPDGLQSVALANKIVADGHSNVAIIYRADEYGKGFNSGLTKALEAGGATVAASVSYDPKATSFDAEVQQVVDAHPDSIVVIGFNEGAQVIKTLIQKGAGPKQVPLYLTDGLQSSSLWKSVDPKNPAVLVGTSGTAPSAAPKNGDPSFPAAFKAYAPGTDTIFSAQAYDCATVIALAAQAAKSNDPAQIQKQMNAVTEGGTACTSYKDCSALLAKGEDINYNGASGPLDFTSVGEPSAGSYDLWHYDNKGAVVTDSQTVINGS